MALQFQPPPDWLIQEYMRRPNDVQQASQVISGVGDIAKEYAQQRQQQQQKAMQARQMQLAEFGAVAPYAERDQVPGLMQKYGVGQTAGSVPPIQSTATTPSPTAGMPDATGATVTQRSPLIDASSKFQWKGSTSKVGMANYKQELDAAKTERDLAFDPNAPVPVMTREAALSAGEVSPKAKIIDPLQPHSTGETRQERLGSSLRKELTSSKQYQNLTLAKTAADNITQAVENPGAYGDLATLFDYMKSLDPTSVVREGEQDTFRKTGSFTESMANTMNKLVNGQTITPEQRKEILKYTKSRLKTAHNVYKNHAEPTLRQGKRIGADPMEIDPFYGQNFDDEKPAQKSFIKPGEEAEYEAYKRSMAGGH